MSHLTIECAQELLGPISDGYSLHQRQSLAERLIYQRTTQLSKIGREKFPVRLTYLIANFGLLLSDRPKSEPNHRRQFVTVPIALKYHTIFGHPEKTKGNGHEENEHAEECFIEYLSDSKHIDALIDQVKDGYGIKTPGLKAFGAVLDLHGTYDMCLACYVSLFKFIATFKGKLRERLLFSGFLTSLATRFSLTIRYSSDRKYHYSGDIDKKQGVIYSPRSARSVDEKNRDILELGEDAIIHSTMHIFWDFRELKSPIELENWTAFSSANGVKGVSNWSFPYTRLGHVELEEDKKSDEKVTTDDQLVSSMASVSLSSKT